MSKVDKNLIFLILHNIRSCYNVGSIFRTADAAGIDKIFLCGYTPTPDKDPKIIKTALGSEKYIPWEKHKQTWRLLEKFKSEDVKIIALEQSAKSSNLFKFKFEGSQPLALIAGHERKGLSKKILKYVDNIVEIPMHGKKESLNVSVAVGIALYQLTKKH
jgi:23S rRNA (guanosine2251-2'-O)-methyltransferase